jgi:hypothetical protein
MSANFKASTDGTQAIIGVGGVDQMAVSNAGIVTANSFVGLNSSSVIATGSTTARTLANRFADVANVLDFGAIGNGIADDTVAFQAAQFSSKSIILVPEGSYNVPGNFYSPDPKLWIYSPSARLINSVNPAPGFRPPTLFYGRVIPTAPYGPICIANESTTANAAGEAIGLRLTNNNFPELTPGANGRVMLSCLVNNVDLPVGTTEVWSSNFVANQIPGEPICRMVAIEAEIATDRGDNSDASSNPFFGFTSNAIEITGLGSSPTGGKQTSAIRTWVNGSTGQNWFQNGIAISRTTKWGLFFKQDPMDWIPQIDTGIYLGWNGATNTHTANGACLRNEGNAHSIISSKGSHVNIIDVSECTVNPGTFARMPSGLNSSASFRNFSNFDCHLSVSSGNTTSHQAGIILSNSSTAKWKLEKLSDDRFHIYGVTNNISPILINETGTIILNVLQSSTSYVNDVAAAAGGVPVGGLYRNGSVVQIRIV